MSKNHFRRIFYYSFGEEIANSITHGIGAGLSVAALVLLIIRAIYKAPPGMLGPYLGGCITFGVSLILLYTMSTLYHAMAIPRAKFVFSVLDHSAIYILIAGSYSGLCLTVLYGPIGLALLAAVWFLAIIGVVVYCIWRERRFKWVSFALYLVMGWLLLPFIGDVWANMTHVSRNLLLAGGLSYTLGCVFYLMNIPWMHAIWHLFVLAGSILHFFALFFAL